MMRAALIGLALSTCCCGAVEICPGAFEAEVEFAQDYWGHDRVHTGCGVGSVEIVVVDDMPQQVSPTAAGAAHIRPFKADRILVSVESLELSERRLALLVAHETGHLLGIDGHVDDRCDAMYRNTNWDVECIYDSVYGVTP